MDFLTNILSQALQIARIVRIVRYESQKVKCCSLLKKVFLNVLLIRTKTPVLESLFNKDGAAGGLQAHKVSSEVLINSCTSACLPVVLSYEF